MTVIGTQVATAYDFFISLIVLHEPDRYTLRPAWAAGIRARIPEAERDFLEGFVPFARPMAWVYALPAPRNAGSVLTALAALPPAGRLEVVACADNGVPCELLRRIGTRGVWDEADFEEAGAVLDDKRGRVRRELSAFLDLCTRPSRSGELLLDALRAYHDNFFAEEEKRILPWLEQAAAEAQELAGELQPPDLLERVSGGVHFDAPPLRRLTLAPSFWSAPLIVPDYLTPDHLLFLFGARPAHVSLVPGAPVPDDLMRALKALADPTRLRILRYLGQEPANPAALARRLRLRPPTVIHHLDALRLARLVQVTMTKDGRRLYALRPDATTQLAASLEAFLDPAAEDTRTEFLRTDVDFLNIKL